MTVRLRMTLLATALLVAGSQAGARTSLDRHSAATSTSRPPSAESWLESLPGGSFRGEVRSFAAVAAAGRMTDTAILAGHDTSADARDDVAPDSFAALSSDVDRWSDPEAADDSQRAPLTASAFVLACLGMLVFMQRRLRRR